MSSILLNYRFLFARYIVAHCNYLTLDLTAATLVGIILLNLTLLVCLCSFLIISPARICLPVCFLRVYNLVEVSYMRLHLVELFITRL